MKGQLSANKKGSLAVKRGSRPEAAIFYCGEGMGLMREEHRLLLAQHQKMSSDEYDQANQRCGE